MMKKCFTFLSLSLFLCPAWADDDHHDARFPQDVRFKTRALTPFAIEGLTGDNFGNLYTTGRTPGAGVACPVWRINLANPSVLVVVGSIPAPSPTTQCSPSGLTFDSAGRLFVTETDRIFSFFPDAGSPPLATLFASGVPGTNGLAFDRDGNLWTGDGTSGQGRVWKITPAGVVTLEFRVPPMRNGTILGGDISVTGANEPAQGVGRQARTYPHTAAGGNPQDLVANGVAFNHEGDLFIADTARGAIWKVEFDRHGNLKSRTDCDSTFAEKTLCFDNIFVAHPLLDGTDGIALDRAGNIWNSANERNAIVVVTKHRQVVEIFRNPPNAAGLRNSADAAVGNDRILETPTSPFLLGHVFCTANSDGNRRDNFPNTAGEIRPAGPNVGKISCIDQPLQIPGLRLPL